MPVTPAPKIYQAGHVKRNPETEEVAIRTIFPEDQGPQMRNMAWLISTKNVGARNAPATEVEDWPDLFTPTPPPAEPTPEV